VTSPLVIWLVSDGKPGHENQSLGLAEAIGRRLPTSLHRIDLAGQATVLRRVKKSLDITATLPLPDLILGAGHATHLPLIGLARRTGAPCIVLMRPSLPTALFDLCLVPDHDLTGKTKAINVIATLGALNRVHPSADQVRHGRVILLGGPSSTHGWDTPAILDAIAEITASQTGWILTDSRRTPDGVRQAIRERFPAIELFPHEETAKGWLPAQLAAAAEVWVSEDSVSMIYEALSSGARVGLLPVPRLKARGRVSRGIDQLISDGYLTPWSAWRESRKLSTNAPMLSEADRCAGLILERWFPQAK
jgi:uncharacterized protein